MTKHTDQDQLAQRDNMLAVTFQDSKVAQIGWAHYQRGGCLGLVPPSLLFELELVLPGRGTDLQPPLNMLSPELIKRVTAEIAKPSAPPVRRPAGRSTLSDLPPHI